MRSALAVASLFLLAIASLAIAQPPGAELRSAVAWIGGGWFEMGSSADDVRYARELCLEHGFDPLGQDCLPELFEDEAPAHRVFVSRYGLDRTEVTHGAWSRCVTAGHCPPPRGTPADERIAREDHPVTQITFAEAWQYCTFAGGRLPTEAEWEHAARGRSTRRFPWGRRYNDRLANHGRGSGFTAQPDPVDGFRYAAPVGSFPDGASPYGVLDLAGNVFEWTADRYAADQYRTGTRVDPIGAADGGERVVRGGSWRHPPFRLRVTNRVRLGEGEAWPDVGFRCAYDPPGSSGIVPLFSAP
jgi:formylglycine-generating enzyme